MTFVTPEFTPVFRAAVRNKFDRNLVYMRFEVVADSVAHAEAKAAALVQDKHPVIVRAGYDIRAKRIQRKNTEVMVLV